MTDITVKYSDSMHTSHEADLLKSRLPLQFVQWKNILIQCRRTITPAVLNSREDTTGDRAQTHIWDVCLQQQQAQCHRSPDGQDQFPRGLMVIFGGVAGDDFQFIADSRGKCFTLAILEE